jgi:hypothetical protein
MYSGCVIILTNLVCVLIGPAIPTSSFHFIQLSFILVTTPFLLPSGQSWQFMSFSITIWHARFAHSNQYTKYPTVFSLSSLSYTCKYFGSYVYE